MEFDSAATTSDMETALALLEFKSEISASASVRKIWVFPTLSGASNFRYRVSASGALLPV